MPKVAEKPNVKHHLKEFADGTYQIVADRKLLLNRIPEFLQLLESSGYLPSTKVREGLYSELGIKKRINHPNALPVAILHKNEVIGCAFSF